jgi:hypothetical protein
METIYLIFILGAFLLGAAIYRTGFRSGLKHEEKPAGKKKRKTPKVSPKEKPKENRGLGHEEDIEEAEEEEDKPSIEEQWNNFLTYESKKGKGGKEV